MRQNFLTSPVFLLKSSKIKGTYPNFRFFGFFGFFSVLSLCFEYYILGSPNTPRPNMVKNLGYAIKNILELFQRSKKKLQQATLIA